MENCLITKLKGVVDNNNLLKFGELRIKTKPNSTNKKLIAFRNMSNKAVVVEADSAILSLTSGSATGSESLTISGNSTVDIYGISSVDVNTLYRISIIEKYGLGELYIEPFEGEIDVTYMTSLSLLQGNTVNSLNGKVIGAIPASMVTISTYYDCTGLRLTQNLPSLTSFVFLKNNSCPEVTTTEIRQRIPNVTNVTAMGNDAKLTGDIAELGKIASLTTLRGTQVQGSLENFVANKRTAGVTSGSMAFVWLPANKITFNGGNVASKESYSFSWTATTITLDGTTIDA